MGRRVPILLGHLQTQQAKADGGFIAPTPLHAAAAQGDLEKLRAALDASLLVGADLDARDAFGATALFAAAASPASSPEAVSLLLAAGADPRIAAADGRMALHAAARACCPESVEALLEAGAAEALDASAAARRESGRDAAGSGGSGRDGDAGRDGGDRATDSLRTPLHEAAAAGGAPGGASERAGEVTVLLLEAAARSRRRGDGGGDGDDGARARARRAASAADRFGRTPLHEALSAGALHCARALAAAGADLGAAGTWDGGNALHAGAAAGRGAALEACLEAAVAFCSSSAARSSSPSASPPSPFGAVAAALAALDASGKTPAEAAAAAGKGEAAAVLKRFEEAVES